MSFILGLFIRLWAFICAKFEAVLIYMTGKARLERILSRPFTTATPLLVRSYLEKREDTRAILETMSRVPYDDVVAAIISTLRLPAQKDSTEWVSLTLPALQDCVRALRSLEIFKREVKLAQQSPFNANDAGAVTTVQQCLLCCGVDPQRVDRFAETLSLGDQDPPEDSDEEGQREFGHFSMVDVGFQREGVPQSDFRGLGILAPALLTGLGQTDMITRAATGRVSAEFMRSIDSNYKGGDVDRETFGYSFALSTLNLVGHLTKKLLSGELDSLLVSALARDSQFASPVRAAALFWGFAKYTVAVFDENWWKALTRGDMDSCGAGVLAWPSQFLQWQQNVGLWIKMSKNRPPTSVFGKTPSALEPYVDDSVATRIATALSGCQLVDNEPVSSRYQVINEVRGYGTRKRATHVHSRVLHVVADELLSMEEKERLMRNPPPSDEVPEMDHSLSQPEDSVADVMELGPL